MRAFSFHTLNHIHSEQKKMYDKTFICIFQHIYSNMISFRFTSIFFGVLIRKLIIVVYHIWRNTFANGKNKYMKNRWLPSSLACELDSFIGKINWRLTIFEMWMQMGGAHTLQQIIPFDFSTSKNENHSYGNHFLYIFKTFFT